MKLVPVLWSLVVLLVLASCNTGLSPVNEPSGFRGVVRFKNWPPPDSVRDLRIVAFESYPTDSSNIISSLLQGTAAFYPDLGVRFETVFPRNADSSAYVFTIQDGYNLQLKNYTYIILAQQYGPNVFTDWRPAGVYSVRPNSFDPASVRVLLHQVMPDININVDFDNPPPRPWR